ncbi:hypothetical protein H6G06_20845 [Anabaena sphaerica FACHB-251]|uniref:Uncharacterized protein n=1 Tax=Anabaena sphaerica FACHB-251 TaxID=2692883 RepID=A0A927A2Y8_9NOST|nr:hypothetical protein [Anabaena sphaerica]MBD2295853.1 hypothetical protein [Anabaena sphaerica FACHB-251]
MPDSPTNIDLSALNLDQTQLRAIEQLLNKIELLIKQDSVTAETYIYKLNNEIIQLKNQKSRANSGMVPASIHELKTAFQIHLGIIKAQEHQSISSHLLIFYAVECGLKRIWLIRRGLKGTDEIHDQTMLTKDGHNLGRWVKELRLPATIIGKYPDYDKIPRFHLAKDGSIHDLKQSHQVWRYGIEIKPEDESNLVEWLKSVCSWIEENINLRR